MAEAHDRKSKRILSREWRQVREHWLGHTPNIPLPGGPPSHQLHELESLRNYLTEIADLQVTEVEEIGGLRAGVLHEAIFLLHKASHVLGASLVHVNQGMCTWSISNAYQASFFAMKAVAAFLGVCVVESDNRHFLVDVWGTSHAKKNRRKGPFIILAHTKRNEQRNLWAYFQRSLEQTVDRDDVWNPDITSFLLKLGHKDFGRQRNNLHYRTSWWPLDDLHACRPDPLFGRWRSLDAIDTNNDPDSPLLIAFSLLGMGHELLRDLATLSVLLGRELSLVDTWLSQPFTNLYRQARARQLNNGPVPQ